MAENAAWGIEIGAYAIKALRLEREGNGARVTDFAYIPHKKVLSTPDLDQDEMVRLGLGQFISRQSLEGEHLVMSVPGHAAFARFAKLPPVDPKKVPDIVKFEAVQQIPFPIDEVEWDYQTFMAEDSPEIEVGIFAITRERVRQRLGLYAELGVSPEVLTLGPVALYNAMAFDHDLAARKGPVIFLDIGTSATDVVVAEEGRCWIRTFPLGGNHFTEAIANAFKLSYSKAEKLKLEAATSKYAKQIMQAMRPVFSDLLQDLQRSIGYYQTLHSEQELSMMVGLGSTFKIPGLRKFLGQQLQLEVVRLDEYKKIQVTGREAASFAENAVNMGTAYGLALQGIGLAAIDANLVPVTVLREQMWHAKTKWFAAAAAIVIAGAAMTLYRPLTEGPKMAPGGVPASVSDVLDRGKRLKTEYDQLRAQSDLGFTAQNMQQLLEDRGIWPQLLKDATEALRAADPQAELLGGDRAIIRGISPTERRLVELRSLVGKYASAAPAGGADPAAAPVASATPTRRIQVTMNVQLTHDRPGEFLNSTVARWLRENAERAGVPYRITDIRTNFTSHKALVVGDDGTVTDQSALAGGGGGTRGGRSGDSEPERPSGFQQPGGGGGGAGFGSGSGAPAGNQGSGQGGGARRRNAPEAGKHTAPGQGLGTGDGAGAGAPGGMPEQPAFPGDTGNTGGVPSNFGTDVQRGDLDLAAMAPIKRPPSVFPADTRLYQVPVTFVIEIVDEPAVPAGTAQAGGTGVGS